MADLAARDVSPDRMPALVADWQTEVSTHHSDKTRANDDWVCRVISKAFAEFTARGVTPPICVEFLKQFRDRPRTHNVMRGGLREFMRYAEEKGYRDPGSNPVASIRTMRTPPRDRYPTDSEVRRLKVAGFYGKDGKRTRQGPTFAAVIDLAYLTGQRIGDLLELRWNKKGATDEAGFVTAPYISDEGIHFKPSKTAGSTGAKVLVQWTPRLRGVIDRIEKMGKRNIRYVITNQSAQRYDYEAFKSLCARAMERSGVKNLHFHDLRAKALTDTEETHGMQAANRKGSHRTESQTAAYVRRRKPQKSEATR